MTTENLENVLNDHLYNPTSLVQILISFCGLFAVFPHAHKSILNI